MIFKRPIEINKPKCQLNSCLSHNHNSFTFRSILICCKIIFFFSKENSLIKPCIYRVLLSNLFESTRIRSRVEMKTAFNSYWISFIFNMTFFLSACKVEKQNFSLIFTTSHLFIILNQSMHIKYSIVIEVTSITFFDTTIRLHVYDVKRIQ